MAPAKRDPAVPPPDSSRRDTRRRFEQWASNPLCDANTLSAVHGIPMRQVAAKEGLAAPFGQSPFALARGQSFERRLFRDRAARLSEGLERAGALDGNGIEFRDLRLKQHGGPHADLDRSRAATTALLQELNASAAKTPWIVASPTILIPGGIMLPEALLVIDVLLVKPREGGFELIVGEIKTYPDRGGYTEPESLAQARAQAGVYVHGLQLVVAGLGLDARLKVSTSGFLVLSRPGSNFPSVRAEEDFRFQALRAGRGFGLLSEAAQKLPPFPEEERIAGVLAAEVNYCEACLSFCERAPSCHRRAYEAGDPAVLGDQVARFLGEVDLHRATALLASGKAKTPAEVELLRLLREARGLEEEC